MKLYIELPIGVDPLGRSGGVMDVLRFQSQPSLGARGGKTVRQILEVGGHPKVGRRGIGEVEAGSQTFEDLGTVAVASTPGLFILPVEGDDITPVESRDMTAQRVGGRGVLGIDAGGDIVAGVAVGFPAATGVGRSRVVGVVETCGVARAVGEAIALPDQRLAAARQITTVVVGGVGLGELQIDVVP